MFHYNAFRYVFPHYAEKALLLSVNQQMAYLTFINKTAFNFRSILLKQWEEHCHISQIGKEINFSLEAFRREHFAFEPKSIWAISEGDSFETVQCSLHDQFGVKIKAFNQTNVLTKSSQALLTKKSIEQSIFTSLLGAVVTTIYKNKSSLFPGQILRQKKQPIIFRLICFLKRSNANACLTDANHSFWLPSFYSEEQCYHLR